MTAGERVLYGVKSTNDKGTAWRHVLTLDGKEGYIYHTSIISDASPGSYKGIIVDTDDNFAALRVGAGTGSYQTAELKSGTKVTVDGSATAADGSKWLHVRAGTKRGYVAEGLVKKV